MRRTPASEETLALIRETPGITVPEIAAQRCVDIAATDRTTQRLQRQGLVRVALERRTSGGVGNPYIRACYPVETP